VYPARPPVRPRFAGGGRSFPLVSSHRLGGEWMVTSVTAIWTMNFVGFAPMTVEQGAVCAHTVPEAGQVSPEIGFLHLTDPADGSRVGSAGFSDDWAVALGLNPARYVVDVSFRREHPVAVDVVAGHCTFVDVGPLPVPSGLDWSEPVRRRNTVNVVLVELDVDRWDRITVTCRGPHRPDWTTPGSAAWPALSPRCTPALRLRRHGEPAVRLHPERLGVTKWEVDDVDPAPAHRPER
jgi:hypothetical protein